MPTEFVKMKSYNPAPKRTAAAAISLFGIICAAACTYFGNVTDKRFPFFCASCTFLLFSLQLLFRFCFTAYTYSVENGILFVKTGFGENKNTVFSLNTELIEQVCERDEIKSVSRPVQVKYNCCQNLFPTQKCRIFYNSGVPSCVTLECPRELLSHEQKL